MPEPPTLFDPGPPVAPQPEPAYKLSATAERTYRRQVLLASGKHPATMLPLLGGDATCSSCVHHVEVHGSRTYHKCLKSRLGKSSSAASDIRVSWSACTLYEAKEAE